MPRTNILPIYVLIYEKIIDAIRCIYSYTVIPYMQLNKYYFNDFVAKICHLGGQPDTLYVDGVWGKNAAGLLPGYADLVSGRLRHLQHGRQAI